MAMSTLESGPKLDWTRDNQMFERYRIWKRKVEFIFCSALSDATPKQLVSYLKYWMGDQGIPLIEKWESTGRLDYSNAEETPATEGGRRRILSSGYRLQTYWDLLDEEFKPKGNKLLSIIELWTRCKQGDKALNQWLTHVYNLVNICKYPEDSIDRIIRDVLIIGCNSNSARDKIIRQGEAVTLNQVIEILQTEESTRSTMQQIQEFQGKPVQSVNYVSYDSRSKKSKKPSNEQNSSSSNSTGPTSPRKRKCFRCGEPYSRKHLQECRAQNIICDGCGIKGHFKRCCKKSGNFPRDNSNRENQSSSTGPKQQNYAAAIPVQADYFDERGIYKEYRPPVVQHPAMQHGNMNILKKVHNPSNAILISEDGVEIQNNTSTSTSDPAPISVPSPDFPFTEFLSTEVVIQSQIDFPSISDTLHPRKNNNSSSKATNSTDTPLKSMQNCSSYEEMREIRDLNISAKPSQSTRDPTTISIPGNSNFRKSTTGTKTDDPTVLPVEISVSFDTDAEFVQNEQLSNNRSVMPTDVQALAVLQDLLSDDFQSKNPNSLQRKGEDKKDEAFQLIQKIHNQLQQVQCDLQKLHSLHKYEF